MVFVWTWFAATESSEAERSDDEKGAVDKVGELVKSGVTKTRPVLVKTGSLLVKGAKNAGTNVISGGRWLATKARKMLDRGGAESPGSTTEADNEPEATG